jgi:hypothetical protein
MTPDSLKTKGSGPSVTNTSIDEWDVFESTSVTLRSILALYKGEEADKSLISESTGRMR